jgi:hypothetical protein
MLPMFKDSPNLSRSNEYLSSRHNNNTNATSLRNDTPRHTFQTQPTQPLLGLLDPRNLIDMLQTNTAHDTHTTIAGRQLHTTGFSKPLHSSL